MIRTDKQYHSALKKIETLKQTLNGLKTKNPTQHELAAKNQQINEQIEQLKTAADDYKTIQRSNPYDIKINSLADLMQIPINYRIAAGMSQDTFAKHVDISTRQIERYEKEAYQKITLSNFKKIITALNIQVSGKVQY